MINPLITEASTVLNGKELPRELAIKLGKIKGEDIIDLVSLANKVKSRFSPESHICTISNAKSGACGEDCSYCAQSSHHSTIIDIYSLTGIEKIVSEASEVYNSGVRKFGIVTSGLGYKKAEGEFNKILGLIDAIYEKFPDMEVCASLGVLSDLTAGKLARHGIKEYNHNIQVDPSRYRELVSTTHNVNDRIETVRLVKKHGIKACSGGIIGLGENMDDRVGLAYTVRDLDADIIPLNVLVPVKGTPLESIPPVSPAEAAVAFSIFRLVNPGKIIKFAAGRESVMKDFQGLLMLAGINGFLTGGYLTIKGRKPAEDYSFMNCLGGFGAF